MSAKREEDEETIFHAAFQWRSLVDRKAYIKPACGDERTIDPRPWRTGPQRLLRGFTLIELLIVVAIVALLMAILTPTLQRAKRQARAVTCRTNLRQWGLLWTDFVEDRLGQFPNIYRGPQPFYPEGFWSHPTIRLCPMATKPAAPTGETYPLGGTFLAWGRGPKDRESHDYWGSYGVNDWMYSSNSPPPNPPYPAENYWGTPYVRGANSVPIHLDSAFWNGYPTDVDPPPECDAIPRVRYGTPSMHRHCMNRHSGYINGLFMDWSARKLGLKELWTLKWHRKFDTAGSWTESGGITPGDWPEWLRRFKDY